jgi:myo-inositol 2-dehydrogenase/D-chiro-inositol 1-dehydrogenase
MEKTKVAILGCGFIAHIHMESYERFVPDAEVVAVYGRNEEKAKAFAQQFGIKEHYTDLDELLSKSDCEVVDICIPNYAHYEACIKSAKSGRHVIIEKPLALTLEQADEMIDTCKKLGKKLMYAEELCFAPKYERVKALVERGAVGDLYMIKQAEKHSGPHSRWFYEKDLAGGGVMMDMGCHALAWFRWILGGNPKIKSVYASMSTVLHDTECDDNTVTLVEFENGVLGIAEDSWAKHGGMDDRIEVYGTKGVSYADLFRGNSALTYSLEGYDYAMEKAGSSQGWSFTVYEEAFNQGYPQELAHFIECIRKDLQPKVTGEDGRAVLEMIYAAYESARTGQKVALPFSAKVDKPVDLWLKK